MRSPNRCDAFRTIDRFGHFAGLTAIFPPTFDALNYGWLIPRKPGMSGHGGLPVKHVCLAAILVAAALVGSYSVAWTEPLSDPDQQIAEMIVRESRSAYYAAGHPCACPEDLARNGSRCGARSAYSRGGRPLCYVSDVSNARIEEYKTKARRTLLLLQRQ